MSASAWSVEAYWMAPAVIRVTLPPKPSSRMRVQVKAVQTTISSRLTERRTIS